MAPASPLFCWGSISSPGQTWGSSSGGAGAGTYPDVLDEDAGALPVSALSALAAASAADAADAAFAAHAVPVSCCWGQVGGRQLCPRADTGHRGPWQGTAMPVKTSLPHNPSSHRRHITPSTFWHAQHRQGDRGWQGTHEGDMGTWPGRGHEEERGCSMGSAKLPFPAAAPSCVAVSLPGGGRRVSPHVPQHGQGWGPFSLPSCTPDLSCQGPGPSGLG